MRVLRQFAALFALGTLVMAVLMAGCGKKEAAAPQVPGQAPGGEVASPAAPARPAGDAWADMAAKRKALSSYKMAMTMDGQAVTQSMKLRDGVPVAMKMAMGNKGWTLTRFDQKVQYVYNPQSGTAMKMSMSDAGSMKDKMDEQIAKFKAEGVEVGNDRVDGVDCWKVSTKSGAAWMDKQYGLPRQMEADGKVTKMKYEAINSVPDSAFELPAGTKVQDMGEMMKQMPKNMPKNMPGMPKGAPAIPGH